jgi:hypothetical protein
MAVENGNRVKEKVTSRLTTSDLDSRIQELTSRLAISAEEECGDVPAQGKQHPHLIAPAELVRRLQSFIVYN